MMPVVFVAGRLNGAEVEIHRIRDSFHWLIIKQGGGDKRYILSRNGIWLSFPESENFQKQVEWLSAEEAEKFLKTFVGYESVESADVEILY